VAPGGGTEDGIETSEEFTTDSSGFYQGESVSKSRIIITLPEDVGKTSGKSQSTK